MPRSHAQPCRGRILRGRSRTLGRTRVGSALCGSAELEGRGAGRGTGAVGSDILLFYSTPGVDLA